jgi:hypothetical protein
MVIVLFTIQREASWLTPHSTPLGYLMANLLARLITFFALLVFAYIVLRAAAPNALRDFFLLLSDLLAAIQRLLAGAASTV